MTLPQLLEVATSAFKACDFSGKGEADSVFEKYGVGNTVEVPTSPYERFGYYRELLVRLRESDATKFEAMHKGTPLYALRVDQELGRFSEQFGIAFSKTDFLERFVRPMLSHGKVALVAAFYAFLLEFDDKVVEIQLRSSHQLGSYQPLFLHLFKGGLLLETLLKEALPQLSSKTLGQILQHSDFNTRVGFKPPSIEIVPVPELCAGAGSFTKEAAFQATGRIRNTMGHNLIIEPLPTIPNDYINLTHQAINAYLYAVAKLFP